MAPGRCSKATWPRPSWTRCASTRPTRASWRWQTSRPTSRASARRSATTTPPWARTTASAASRRPVPAPSPWARSSASCRTPPAATLPLQAGVPIRRATPSADWLHLYTEAARLAFADRALYVGDPDFVQPPAGNWMSLLDPAYLAGRAKLIGQAPGAPSMKVAQPGNPGAVKTSYAPMPDQPEYGTSHISIVDAQGNALAMTTTIEDVFGARQMVSTRQWLPAEQRTDRLQLRAHRRRRQADRQPRAAGQAAALVDGAHAGVRQGDRPVPPERRQPRRRADHPLHRQDAVRHAELGPERRSRPSTCPTSDP